MGTKLAGAPALDAYLHQSFDLIQYVADNMATIKAVADHLTPVEDLVDFQVTITELHAKLALLVEASELIIQTTPAGLALLLAQDAAAQRLALGLKDLSYYGTADDVADLMAQMNGALGTISSLQLSMDTQFTALVDAGVLEAQLRSVLSTQLTDLINQVTGTSDAITSLGIRTQALEGSVSTQAQALTQLGSSTQNLATLVEAQSSAMQALTTYAETTRAGQMTSASDVGVLQSRLTDAESNLAQQADATTALTTTVQQTNADLVIAASDVTKLKASITGSGNLLPNPSFAANVRSWAIYSRGAGWAVTTLQRDLSVARLPAGVFALGLTATGVPAGSIGVRSDKTPVAAQSRYILSGYLAAENCTFRMEWRIYNAAGVQIEMDVVGEATNIPPATNLIGWVRQHSLVTTPIDADTIEVQLWVKDCNTGDPRAWCLRPMLEEAGSLQELPSAWVDGTSGLEDTLATATHELAVRVTNNEGEISTTASEVTELGTRTGSAEATLVNELIIRSNKDSTLSSAVNLLSGRLTSAEANITGAATSVSGLTNRVGVVEGAVTAQGSSLTSLQAQVNAIDADTGGSGAAISALDTRVTATEDAIDSHSSAITTLQSSVTSANKTFVQATAPATTGRTAGDIWIDTSRGNLFHVLEGGAWVPRADTSKNTVFVQGTQPTAKSVNDLWFDTSRNNRQFRWNGATWVEVSDTRTTANATAITALETRATAIEGLNVSQSSAITTLQNTVDNGANGVVVTAAAVSALTTRVSSAESASSSQGSAITSLQNTVNNGSTGLAATASAVSTLTTRVSSAEGSLSSQASSISSISSTVGNHTASISSQQTSLNGVLAKAGVTTNVNGYITGWQLNNNGSSGDFKVLASVFSIVDPSNGDNLLTFADGNLWVSGIIESSVMRSSAMEMGSTRIHTGGGRLAPFVIRDVACVNAGGVNNANRTLTLDSFVSPAYGSGYHYKRFAAQVMDVFIDVMTDCDHPTDQNAVEVVHVQRSVDSGAWVDIVAVTGRASYASPIPIVVRYTTPTTWSTIAFRSTTTNGNTVAMSLSVMVLNFNESGNAADSNSGVSGATSAPPPTGGGGSDPFCVDWETTVLPDGRYVRSLPDGALVECVDVATGERSFMPLLGMSFGHEDCYRVTTAHGEIIQSKSTPMNMRDGSVVRTPDLAGLDLLTHAHGWESCQVEFMGSRRVCKPDFGDRMFFAGTSAAKTLATHNIRNKPTGVG